MDRWIGKTAVVTGASAGIGAAISVELANAGLKVVGLARRPHLVDKLKEQVSGKGGIVSCQCDVSNPDDVAAAFKWIEDKMGGTQLLVNNAGIYFNGNITDLGDNQLKDEDIISTIDINLKGLIISTRYAISSMKKHGFDGHIININSIAGHYTPFSSLFNIYSSTKYGVTGFTEALANELADFKNKIKVTSLCPGLVITDMTAGVSDLVEYTPLKPKDIADAVLYVVSTPPNVNITEITVRPVAEKRL